MGENLGNVLGTFVGVEEDSTEGSFAGENLGKVLGTCVGVDSTEGEFVGDMEDCVGVDVG